MTVHIFCDYGNTLNKDDSLILLQTLQEMKSNGATIWLATDGRTHEAEQYIQELAEKGYCDLFERMITKDNFEREKKSPYYWPNIAYNLDEYLEIDLSRAILLDDSLENLKEAAINKVNAICSMPRHEAAENLKSTYAKLCNQ